MLRVLGTNDGLARFILCRLLNKLRECAWASPHCCRGPGHEKPLWPRNLIAFGQSARRRRCLLGWETALALVSNSRANIPCLAWQPDHSGSTVVLGQAEAIPQRESDGNPNATQTGRLFW